VIVQSRYNRPNASSVKGSFVDLDCQHHNEAHWTMNHRWPYILTAFSAMEGFSSESLNSQSVHHSCKEARHIRAHIRPRTSLVITRERRGYHRLDPNMCIIGDSYHVRCGHYGSKINSWPCVRARGQAGLTKGCWDSHLEGIFRLDSKCAICVRIEEQETRNPRYTPFLSISPGAFDESSQRRRRSKFGFQSDFPWTSQADSRNLGRRRSVPTVDPVHAVLNLTDPLITASKRPSIPGLPR
jgi:hypothetical protein